MTLGGSIVDAFQHAVNNNIQIVNNSDERTLPTVWKYKDKGDTFYRLETPYFKTVIDGDGGDRGSIVWKNTFRNYRSAAVNADIVFVWVAGNGYWHYDPTTDGVGDPGRFDLCGFPTIEAAVAHTGGNGIDCPGSDNLENQTQQQLFDNILGVDENDDPDVVFFDDEVSRNDPGGHSLAPFYERDLFGKWVVAVATKEDDKLAEFSNGCGVSKFWCLAAPGHRLRVANTGDDQFISGTSFATPIVSGALAVLKSRLPGMPMEVVRAILLTTATDLGVPGVDNVYGWGLVNLEEAIKFENDLSYSNPSLTVINHAGFEVLTPGIGVVSATGIKSPQNIKLSDVSIKLPANLANVKKELAKIEIAVSGVGDAYYNTKLDSMVDIEIASTESLGDAATDMLLPTKDNDYAAGMLFTSIDSKSGQFQYIGAEVENDSIGTWRFQHNFCDNCEQSVWSQWDVLNDDIISTPFFAKNQNNVVLKMKGDGLRPFASMSGKVHGDNENPYNQFGLRWKQSHINGRFGYMAEFSQINESDSFWGANFGSLGSAKAKTHQGKFALSGNITRDWQAHASYEQSFANVDVKDGGILSSVSKLRSQGWGFGVEGKNILQGGDRLRLSAKHNAGVQGGKARLGYVRAEGDFTCAFYKNALGDEYNNFCGGANAQQTIYTQSDINLAGIKEEIYALGYSMQLSDKAQWALGAEYEANRNIAAFSTQLKVVF